MTIKAILRDGHIQPLEPLPPDWEDGQELLVEPPDVVGEKNEIDRWAQDLNAAAAEVPLEEHEQLNRAFGQIEQESKDSVRREWGLP